MSRLPFQGYYIPCMINQPGCSYTEEHGHCCFCNIECHPCSQACKKCMRNVMWHGVSNYYVPPSPPSPPVNPSVAPPTLRRSQRLIEKAQKGK